MFGPPMTYWTGRFESKHRTAKILAESAKNVINITKTISERQQMRAASIYYRGMFNFEPYTLPNVVLKKTDIVEDSEFYSKLKTFMGDSDLFFSDIFINNQVYKNGDLIVLHVYNPDLITVGLIQTILLKNRKVYFVVQKYTASRNVLQYFESNDIIDSFSTFHESSTLVDYKPLIKRGTTKKFVFVLHHHLSFQYD